MPVEVYIDTTFYHIILTFQAYNYPTCGCDQVALAPGSGHSHRAIAATYANQAERWADLEITRWCWSWGRLETTRPVHLLSSPLHTVVDLLPPQGGDQRSRLHHKRLSWLSAAVFDPLLAGQTNELLSHTVFLFCPRSGPVKHSQTLPEKVITTHWLGWLSLNPSWMRSGLASFFFISCLKTVFWIDFSSVKLWISWHSQH